MISPLSLEKERKWGPEKLGSASVLYLEMLVDELTERRRGSSTSSSSKEVREVDRSRVVEFVRDLMQTRYGNLFATQQLPVIDVQTDYCAEDIFSRKERKSLRKEFQGDVSALVEGLMQFPEDTRNVWLGNTVEFLAYYTTKNVTTAPSFIKSCFSEQ